MTMIKSNFENNNPIPDLFPVPDKKIEPGYTHFASRDFMQWSATQYRTGYINSHSRNKKTWLPFAFMLPGGDDLTHNEKHSDRFY